MGAQIKYAYGGKIRIKPPYKYTSIWGVPVPKEPNKKLSIHRLARPIDVNHIRSEPGSTRLSQDDGSMQRKLPQTINISIDRVIVMNL